MAYEPEPASDEINRRSARRARDRRPHLGSRSSAGGTSLSSPAVTERVKRLEQAGVITGYRAEVDPRALGYKLTAIVRVKPAVRQLATVLPSSRAEDPSD